MLPPAGPPTGREKSQPVFCVILRACPALAAMAAECSSWLSIRPTTLVIHHCDGTLCALYRQPSPCTYVHVPGRRPWESHASCEPKMVHLTGKRIEAVAAEAIINHHHHHHGVCCCCMPSSRRRLVAAKGRHQE